MTRRKSGRMAKLGKKTINQTNQELKDEELEMLLRTAIDWEALRPQVTNPALYEQLIVVVNEATQNNEGVAQLKSRLQQLGEEGLALATEVIGLLP